MKDFFRNGGIGEILKVAIPLVVATSCHAVNIFTDRVMLARYSQNAMAASLPAGITSFSFTCFFFGTVAYTSSFVAQYTGAGKPRRVGQAVWQGVLIALAGGMLLSCGYFIAPWLFRVFGHSPEIQLQEIQYFRILSTGSCIMLSSVALSTFWSGRGLTGMIMATSLLTTACNVPLNYLFIFGRRIELGPISLAIPEMGIAGAAWGTLGAGMLGLTIYAIGFWGFGSVRRTYGTCNLKPDPELFWRILRYGAPSGIQLLLDLTAFTVFVVALGKISDTVLVASGIALGLNSIAFQPMTGIGQAVSILVGQAVGSSDIPRARRVVRNAAILILGYMAIMAVFFVVWPAPALAFFHLKPGAVMQMTRSMLCFIAAYLLFDGMCILYSNAIKGAGDTKAAMWISISCAWIAYALPCVAAFQFFTSDTAAAILGKSAAESWCLWSMWSICVFYIVCCGCVFRFRYATGKWTRMRVIENS